MGEPQTPHFHDFRISGRVPGSQNQLFISLETPGYLKQIKKIPGIFSKILFSKSQMCGHLSLFDDFGKGGQRNIPKFRLIKYWKSWRWGQYLPESMKWIFRFFWNQQRNIINEKQNTKNQQPNTKNQETEKPRKQQLWFSIRMGFACISYRTYRPRFEQQNKARPENFGTHPLENVSVSTACDVLLYWYVVEFVWWVIGLDCG